MPGSGHPVPRRSSRRFVGNAEATGKLRTFRNTAVTGLDIRDGRIAGVETERGHIETSAVFVCAGLM